MQAVSSYSNKTTMELELYKVSGAVMVTGDNTNDNFIRQVTTGYISNTVKETYLIKCEKRTNMGNRLQSITFDSPLMNKKI